MSITITYDTKKSIEQLENIFWGDELPYPSTLVKNCYLFRKKPIEKLTVEELRLLIGQNIGLPYIMDSALNILIENPFTEGDLYPADLFHNVLRSDLNYWKMNNLRIITLLQIIQKYEDETGLFPNPKINEDINKAINNFKINTSETQSKP